MSEVPSASLIFNDSKAGLNEISRTGIANKITEISRNTKFYQKQKERSQSIEVQLYSLIEKWNKASVEEKEFANFQSQSHINSLKKIPINQTYFHVDLDMFFCAVEQLCDPSLKDIPFVVGGPIKHGIVSASNYHARKHGIRSGMATFIAVQLYPDLKIVDHHGEKYQEYSKKVHKIFKRYDPNLISFGCDEALLNVTSFENPDETAKELQKTVYEEIGLTVSIGIAHTAQLAKIGSDVNKPNGIFHVPDPPDNFLHDLPIRKIPGIGGSMEQLLHGLKIETVGDILKEKSKIWFLFRQKATEFLFRAALGVPTSRVFVNEQKSFSLEKTFDTITNVFDLLVIAELLCVKLSEIIDCHQVLFKTVTVKFKSEKFAITSRSMSSDVPLRSIGELVDSCKRLIHEENRLNGINVRLLGVKVSNFIKEGESIQKSIFDFGSKGSKTIMAKKPKLTPYGTKTLDEIVKELKDSLSPPVPTLKKNTFTIEELLHATPKSHCS